MSAIVYENAAASAAARPLQQGGITFRNYVIVLLQLGLLAVLFRQFQIESGAFLQLTLLAFAGFTVHAVIPLQWRLTFFLALSLAGIMVVLGVMNGLAIIGIGLVLIGICHLRIPIIARALLLLTAGSVLALARAKWIDASPVDAIWPILGSMFMFRLIVYFYDLRHGNVEPSPARTLSYFFMLPNACFPLFPVIDYKTFRRNYYDDDAYRIYQVGIDWMVRGVVHLLLYRYIYYHLTLAPSEVTGPSEFLQYVTTNFLLYLRVSGLFHLIIGMLYLFGFRLPETHNRYLLASSFTDFWRRINIYWKEFMQKIFYYPAVFKLRKLGTAKAMVVATLYVFILTWLLHAYQWFWLRGTSFFVFQDILFWLILGILVAVNALYEMKFGRRRTLGGSVQTWRTLAIVTLKTFATFWVICVLWSFWTADSIPDWLSLLPALKGNWTLDALLYPAIVLGVIVLGNIERGGIRNTRASEERPSTWLRARFVTLVLLVGLVGLSIESVATQVSHELATVMHSLRSGRLSRVDNAKLERGYYENLLSVDRFNSQLWEVYTKRPANWLEVQGGLKRFTGGFGQIELAPSLVLMSNYGPISINRWGMRDQDYELKPAPGTYRIAMLGASSVMGWGVPDGHTFEALVENRLNGDSNGARRFEILNFAVQGYEPTQQLVAAEKALTFSPHALFYVAAGRELSRAAWYLVEVVQKGIAIPYQPLRDIVTKAGLRSDMHETTARRKLDPFRDEILSWTYRRMAETARAAGAVPVFVFLPQVREGAWQDETAETLRIARDSGFVVISLAEIYKDVDIDTIRLAEWDDHPNVQGHQLIASRLYEAMREKWDAIVPRGASRAQ